MAWITGTAVCADSQTTVIRNVTVHTVSGDVIADGGVVIADGRIQAVGPADQLDSPTGAQVLKFAADEPRHLYPGLIDADTALGLIEIEAVRATRDTSETGDLNPNAKALVAFNPDSELIPVARADGVMLALVVPRGRLLRGQSALVKLDGWTGVDMALRPRVGMHLSWPSPPRRRPWQDEEDRAEQRKRNRERKQQLDDLFDQAVAYAAALDADPETPRDLRLAALVPVVKGELPLFVHANDVRQIEEAVAFAVKRELRLVIVGGYDAEKCATLLIDNRIPVVVTGTHRLPRHRHSVYDEPYSLPARLKAAGVKFCLSGYDRFSASAVRNLPQHAGTAAAYGLGTEEAVRAITLSAAEVLGVADRVGSIDPGKDATLIITTGDVLEISSQVTHAFIEGRVVDLDNRHKRLYRKYQQKHASMPQP